MKDGTVIVISRQYGSGGRELAQILSQKLGLHLYDRQLIHRGFETIGRRNSTPFLEIYAVLYFWHAG